MKVIQVATLRHPTKEEYIKLLLSNRRNSRRAINRCTRSVWKYEGHLTQIMECEEILLGFGIITEKELWVEKCN